MLLMSGSEWEDPIPAPVQSPAAPSTAQRPLPMLKGKILGMDMGTGHRAQGTGLAHRHLGNRHNSTNMGKTLFLETGFHLAC